MKTLLLSTALMLAATPAFAKEYTIKEVTGDGSTAKPYFFSPENLTIQPGDTVTFVNAQDDIHDVMFVEVPKGVDEMIMSDTLENKGDKFSYTFTVPGSYSFHCHPHEQLGMKGRIVVGTPSVPGETVKMDHHAHKEYAEAGTSGSDAKAVPATSGTAIEGTGKILNVDLTARTVKIDHDPIKALGWPKMKMQFNTDPSADLAGIKEGDAVHFKLKAVGDDDYVVTEIGK